MKKKIAAFAIALLALLSMSCSRKEPCDHYVATWEYETHATCTSEGKKTGKCEKCGAVISVEVEKLGHSFVGGYCVDCGCPEDND